ncbi:MAG: hypothetical protein ABR529_03665, partial [Actinomycetota bacterium]
ALDSVRARRIADNESLTREVNERIERYAESSVSLADGEKLGFVCECGDPECSAEVQLTLTEYEAVRGHPARFAILPGHDIPSVEMVIERHDGYDVVEKMGDTRPEVIEDDPRS